MSFLRRDLATALCVVAVLCCARGAAAQVVVADANGDGIRVEAAPTGTEVLVHTSHRRHPQRLRVRPTDRIVRLVVSDVDRDGRADIIVSTRWSGLQIWLNTGHGRFRPARTRTPVTPDWRSSQGAEDDPPSGTTDDGADAAGFLVVASARARAPAPDRVFRPFIASAASPVSRSARPRVSRGPPLLSALS